ncbi:MAG TPA: GNAT family N-acetyltransferase [Solirubrobacteraceae bacterium]|nr:GNAT family N-acetyltransferase [Solirubrobacteraceae bacterium]
MADRMLTARLLLRRWRDGDREPFAALNADPEVMERFPALLSREQSDVLVDRIEGEFEQRGYGLWAVEVRETGRFIGFTGLLADTFPAPFTPAVEVGWRLARAAWGRGYATEAAEAALAVGFREAGLEEIVSITTPGNVRSRAVMERLGMTRDPDGNFEHPRIPAGHRLRRHVLYRLPRSAWVERHGAGTR